MNNFVLRHFPLVFSISIHIFIKNSFLEFTIYVILLYILYPTFPLSICCLSGISRESFGWQISGNTSLLILYSALHFCMVLYVLYLWQLLCMHMVHPFSCTSTLRQKLNWILFTSFKMVNKVPCTHQFKKNNCNTIRICWSESINFIVMNRKVNLKTQWPKSKLIISWYLTSIFFGSVLLYWHYFNQHVLKNTFLLTSTVNDFYILLKSFLKKSDWAPNTIMHLKYFLCKIIN